MAKELKNTVVNANANRKFFILMSEMPVEWMLRKNEDLKIYCQIFFMEKACKQTELVLHPNSFVFDFDPTLRSSIF